MNPAVPLSAGAVTPANHPAWDQSQPLPGYTFTKNQDAYAGGWPSGRNGRVHPLQGRGIPGFSNNWSEQLIPKPATCFQEADWVSRWREYRVHYASVTQADTEARRTRCFGHILDLVAQNLLHGDNAASFELQSEASGMLEQAEEDLEHWRAKGPVGKLHNIVKFIRASPQRTEAFKAYAMEQEEADIYKLAKESTAELEVIQNNATRWNSTYMMIERGLIKQSELNNFIQELGVDRPAYLDMIYRYQLCYLDISILIYIDIDITLCLLNGYPD
ncbi:hypothetical protein FOFC_17601 [Fusarium oxysporum]|nr:hypothetical protein FOFC_17601 [Fusarium oxysporum]